LMNISDFVTPAGVCLSKSTGSMTESMMYDCDSETVMIYEGDSCDGEAYNSTTEEDLQCDGQDCDYAVVTMFEDINGTCNTAYYMDYAFTLGCVSVEGYNLNLKCNGADVVAEVFLSECGVSTGSELDAAVLMSTLLGTSCFDLTCYEAPTMAPTFNPTVDPTSETTANSETSNVVEGDASCMLSVGGMTMLLAILGLVQ